MSESSFPQHKPDIVRMAAQAAQAAQDASKAERERRKARLKKKQATMEPLPPLNCTHVDDYTKIKKLGEGSYGTVFSAKHTKTGRIVALKKLKVGVVVCSRFSFLFFFFS